MKTTIFVGTDSFGKHIQVAISIEGVQFWRTYAYNGYAMAWTKWEVLSSPVEVSERGGVKYVKWGFNELMGCEGVTRLPKLTNKKPNEL